MRGFTVEFPLFKIGEPRIITIHAILASLENLTKLNQLWLWAHPETPKIYESGVVYQREKPRREMWQSIPFIIARGSGDCEDLACWRAAELRCEGKYARPAITVRRRIRGPFKGGILVHVITKTDSGDEDPSLRLGM